MKQKKQIALLAGLVILAWIVWRSRYSDLPAVTDVAALAKSYPTLGVDNPQLRWWELNDARKTEYKTNGRNIFIATLPPPPPQPVVPNPDPGPIVVPPPPPPTLPVKFFGYGTIPQGAPRRAFFSDGDQIYIVAEGEMLLGRFRIIRIGNANLEFEEISTGRRGTAALEEPAPQA